MAGAFVFPSYIKSKLTKLKLEAVNLFSKSVTPITNVPELLECHVTN